MSKNKNKPKSKKKVLEVCVDSIESAVAAASGGASRLELCSALSEGGLTPTPGFLRTLKHDLNLKIPIFCMLRPRQGNDFIYSEHEIQLILYDMEVLRQNGCDGFVFGALTPNREINTEQCTLILKNANGLPVTFHRAFDLTRKEKMHDTCELIASLGFQRILTSGFERSAEIGLDNLKNLINKKSTDIIVMPGAGISPQNLRKILEETNCKEFHASAKVKKTQKYDESNIPMGTSARSEIEDNVFVTDIAIVQELVAIAKQATTATVDL